MTKLDGIDPDEVFSEVPYEKGYLFLRALEEQAGRAAFDRFLRAYVSEFRFGAIDSDDFVRLVERELPGALAAVDGRAWLDGVGVPPGAPAPRARKLEAVEARGGARRRAGGGRDGGVGRRPSGSCTSSRCRGRSPAAPSSTRASR